MADIFAAAERNDVEEARRLLNAGADPAARDPYGWTPLFISARLRKGGAAVARMLLAEYRAAYPVEELEKLVRGNHILVCAAIYDHPELASELLECGVDINAKDDRGFTAAHAAIEHGSKRALEVLLAAHADVNLPDQHNITPLIAAARKGDTTAVQALLAAGADVEHRDEEGTAALGRAAEGGHAAVVQALLGAGARVADGTATRLNRPPIVRAASGGHEAVVRLLLDAGVDANTSDFHEHTPLMAAAGSGRADVVQLLLERGAEVNHRSHSGNTAFWWACRSGALEVAQLLHARGADPTIPGGKKDETPLQVAEAAAAKDDAGEDAAVDAAELVRWLSSITGGK